MRKCSSTVLSNAIPSKSKPFLCIDCFFADSELFIDLKHLSKLHSVAHGPQPQLPLIISHYLIQSFLYPSPLLVSCCVQTMGQRRWLRQYLHFLYPLAGCTTTLSVEAFGDAPTAFGFFINTPIVLNLRHPPS